MENASLSLKTNLMTSERKWLFNGPKFKTSGVDHYVSEEIQTAIWNYIEARRSSGGVPLDYLQVFTLKPLQKQGLSFQLIECFQEVPEYREEILIPMAEPIYEKLYIIDDIDHVVLLKANEY